MKYIEPLFILSPPRSFSSLISSVIGQHPQIHAFPELQVFGRSSIHEMIVRNQESLNRLASPGSIRSIAEIHEGRQTDESCARAWLWLQRNSEMTPVELFEYLREKVNPLVAVEKTPVNTLKSSRLKEILSAYPNARYLHLTRSVVGNFKSLKEFLGEREKFAAGEDTEQLSSKYLSMEHPASIWLASHTNVLNIRPLIKSKNYLRIKGEDLLSQPHNVLKAFCEWMGINSGSAEIEAMLRPHESPYACIGPRIAHGGNDGKFMRQPVLKIKKISSTGNSFHQIAEPRSVELDREYIRRRYSELCEEDQKKIQEWAEHLFMEIERMQCRLGYQ